MDAFQWYFLKIPKSIAQAGVSKVNAFMLSRRIGKRAPFDADERFWLGESEMRGFWTGWAHPQPPPPPITQRNFFRLAIPLAALYQPSAVQSKKHVWRNVRPYLDAARRKIP
ncbi:MAG: hypothetical protein AAGD05_14220 [Bacteroidota bacterium]